MFFENILRLRVEEVRCFGKQRGKISINIILSSQSCLGTREKTILTKILLPF